MDIFRGADKKLGELMLRGWTMLADTCTTCNCPLTYFLLCIYGKSNKAFYYFYHPSQ